MSQSSLFFMESLSPLYEDVQTSACFSDSKLFVDSIPLTDTKTLLAKYASEKNKKGFDLKNFVQTHFQIPEETDTGFQSSKPTAAEHIGELWEVLTRKPAEKGGTLLPLPNDYVVPGGRFREVYYWDSYFTMLGLQISGRMDLVEKMIDNFAYLIDTVGFIPNGNRTYYLGRSQPPFFSLMLTILLEEKGEEMLWKYIPQLEKEYAFWMEGAEELDEQHTSHRRVVRMPDGSLLNRYWDDKPLPRPEAFHEDTQLAAASGRNPEEVYRHIRAAAESGWDFSSRWFRDARQMSTIQTTDIIPVDLNCLILFMETLLASVYEKKEPGKFKAMLAKAEQRKKAIQDYCWDETKGFYFDYQFKDKKNTEAYTLAALFPLFISIAEYDQSILVAKNVEELFLKPGGLLTTLSDTGQQWDAPNGWAPLQWIAYKGLNRVPYLHCDLAQKIRENWMRTNEKVYAATGKMMEKYNVTDKESLAGGGEYPNQDGFGWTNGVYLKFHSL